jgi:arabinogalactan oligomer/maltooligosaccharide transport system substrate-binding protein
VTFWHGYATGSAEEAAMTKLVEQAGKDLPNIKINVLQVPFGDIFNKYRTDVAAGGGPDMFIAPNDSMGDDARAGLIADITDLLVGKLDGYSQLSIDGMTLDGAIYGVPESLKAVALYYNKDMLPEPPTTTDELKALMEGDTPVSVSFGCYHHWGFYSAFGGNILDANWKFVADQGGVADAFAYLNDLYQIAVEKGLPKNDGDAAAPFREGKVAITTNGNWALGDYETALGDKLGVVPLPSGPGGPASPLLGVDGYYLNPNSQNLEAAIELALYLTNSASQTLMMNEAGHVPARIDVEVTDPLLKGFADAFQTAQFRPQVPEMDKYWANFCGDSEVFEKGTPAADWVKTATESANKP